MMRRFVLLRHGDITGISGTGVVAHGIEFTDGTCAVHWLGDFPCVQVWPAMAGTNGVNGVRVIHGHSGRTVVRWLDPFRTTDDVAGTVG